VAYLRFVVLFHTNIIQTLPGLRKTWHFFFS